MQSQTSTQSEEHILMSDGFKLFCRRWPASQEAERVVIFLHGIEVHSGAFRFFGPELANNGSEVYAFDRRGMGNSKEPNLPRGDTQSFERHLEDITEVVEYARKSHQGKKLFIFGHSVGCAYVLWYVAHNPEKIDGCILAAPPVETGFKLPTSDTLKIAFSPLIHHHSMFNFVDEWPQEFKLSEEYKLISGDELCTKLFGLGFLFDLSTKVSNKILSNASKVEKPSLLLHGDSDLIALPKSSPMVMEKLISNDKTLKTFVGADHWFYQSIIPTMGSKYDVEKKRTVSSYVSDWLKKH